MIHATNDSYDHHETLCPAGHSWIAGMIFVDPEDVEFIAEEREAHGLPPVECKRCGTQYYTIAKEGTLPEPAEVKPIAGWTERLKSAGFPIRWVYRDDVSEDRSVGPLYELHNSLRVSEVAEDNSLPFVDLGSVAQGDDSYGQTSTYRRSNFRVLQGDDDTREANGDPRRFVTISYSNTDSLAAFIEDLEEDDVDTLIGLALEYPILDDSDLSELEFEEESESWDQWLKSDVESELWKIAIDDMPEGSLDNPPWYAKWDDMASYEQRDLWWMACEHTDNYPEHNGIEVTWPDWQFGTVPELRRLLIERASALPGQEPLPGFLLSDLDSAETLHLPKTPLTIGDRSRDGLLEITDTNWDSNGTLRVTVRELIGGQPCGWIGGLPIARMRRLARKALDHPDTIRSSREVNRSYANGSWSVTFAVSRLSD